MTNVDIVSQMTNTLKTLNKDNRFSRRYILRTLQDVASFLISQKWGERGLLSETSLYTDIPCFEFKKIDVKDCPSLEFRMCKTLMKSKKPLPKLIFSRIGSSIKNIVSLDGDFTFSLVDDNQYRRNKNRRYKVNNEVFVYLGSDNHLYIPDVEIYSVDLTILTLDSINSEGCSECKEKNKCGSYWDKEFIAPSKLIESIKNIALQRLGASRQIIEDQNANGIENG